MKLAVAGNDESFHELTQGVDAIEWVRVKMAEEALSLPGCKGFFNLGINASDFDYSEFAIPVFINSVSRIAGRSTHIIRINGWKGFLQNNTWEIAGSYNDDAKAIFQRLNKKIILTADVPGFISASVIAMIINEGYFAKAEQVSSEAEIDLAMKLGTNYPYGPFEWAARIGLKNIYDLLLELSIQNKKYEPAPLLTAAVNEL